MAPMSEVTMTCSVDSHVAGDTYDIPAEQADSYILRGYATGNLSRDYTDFEVRAANSDTQKVRF